MASRAELPQPSPELFMETLRAHQRTAALKGAIELDVFTAIGSGKNTAADLARHCQASERGMRILCDYLVIIGFLTKRGSRYALTHDSTTFLDRRSPACVVSVTEFLTSPIIMDSFKDVAALVRKGGSIHEGTVVPEHPVWVQFARAMAPIRAVHAEHLAKLLRADAGGKRKVLDVAAGHGLFGIALAKSNPKAEIVAVDWPNVLAVAKENAQAAGVADRYRTIPGSAFDVDFGAGYDLILITNFLHHFDPPTIDKFLRKTHSSLAAGGRAVTLEWVPNEDRVSPPEAAAFSMVMLGTTPAGDAYTFSEYQRMFRGAGFSSTEMSPLPSSFEQVILAQK